MRSVRLPAASVCVVLYLRAATVIGHDDTCKRVGQAAFIRANQTASLIQVGTQLEPVAVCKTIDRILGEL